MAVSRISIFASACADALRTSKGKKGQVGPGRRGAGLSMKIRRVCHRG